MKVGRRGGGGGICLQAPRRIQKQARACDPTDPNAYQKDGRSTSRETGRQKAGYLDGHKRS